MQKSSWNSLEGPEWLSSGVDAIREMAVALIVFGSAIYSFSWPLFLSFSAGWLAWRVGRSGWLGWSRLERLHRLIEEERYEIEHHRDQEREELYLFYRAKGFEGRLLDEVVEVLMADGDRLLQVMVEEELGLHLEFYDHPLKQALGAALGGGGAVLLSLFGGALLGLYGLLGGAMVALGLGGYFASRLEKNRPLPAVVWTLALGVLAFGVTHFLRELL